MSADLLREAAALMRERAEAATPGGPRWETEPDEMHGPSQAVILPADSDSAVAFAGADDAEHIASWHPTVALAVADWLTEQASAIDMGEDDNWPPQAAAIRVARAYLNAPSP